MAGDKIGSRHVVYEQVKAMIDFMGQNIDFATGSLRTLEARHTSKKLWNDLTRVLNDCRGGTKKSADSWSKYWSDFKNKLKNKARLLKKQKRGSTLKKTIQPLTKLEKRALFILGPNFERKSSRIVSHKNPLSDDLPPKIKLEAYQENNVFCYSQSETHNRLSSSEDNNESADSSNGDWKDNGEFSLNEPLIHNLYPKWLIEVEKKRAEAELLRAKAEEKRASTAVRSAKVALLQAEAMKKLANAATTQAAAVARIAAAIENRTHVEDVGSVSSTVLTPHISI